jgi:hypothetical protein
MPDSLDGIVSTTTSLTQTQTGTVGSSFRAVSVSSAMPLNSVSGPIADQLWVSNRSLAVGASETLDLLSLADTIQGATGIQTMRQVRLVRIANSETVTGPPSRRLTSVRAVAGRPAPPGAATTAKRSVAAAEEEPGRWPSATIAACTARMPTTVCSSAWRRNRGGSGGAPGTDASRSTAIPAAWQVTWAWTATGQEMWGIESAR